MWNLAWFDHFEIFAFLACLNIPLCNLGSQTAEIVLKMLQNTIFAHPPSQILLQSRRKIRFRVKIYTLYPRSLHRNRHVFLAVWGLVRSRDSRALSRWLPICIYEYWNKTTAVFLTITEWVQIKAVPCPRRNTTSDWLKDPTWHAFLQMRRSHWLIRPRDPIVVAIFFTVRFLQ